MPVEIKELVIRAVYAKDKSQEVPNSTSNWTDTNELELIEACVEQVLKILDNRQKR